MQSHAPNEIRTPNQRDSYLDLLAKCLTGWIYEESAWQRTVKLAIEGHLVQLPEHLLLLQKAPMDRQEREEGRDCPLFGYSMIGLKRLAHLRWCIEQVLASDVPGDFIETGVWRGGSCIYMRALLKAHGVTDRTVWVADSFVGM